MPFLLKQNKVSDISLPISQKKQNNSNEELLETEIITAPSSILIDDNIYSIAIEKINKKKNNNNNDNDNQGNIFTKIITTVLFLFILYIILYYVTA